MSDSDDDHRKKRKKEKKEKKEKKSKKKKMKLVETADERKQRRMMKKQKKAQEFFGYTNEANRWGDTNLTSAFVWQKKVDKEVRPPQYLLPPRSLTVLVMPEGPNTRWGRPTMLPCTASHHPASRPYHQPHPVRTTTHTVLARTPLML